MSVFQAMRAGLTTETDAVFDFALTHPGGLYIMGMLITALAVIYGSVVPDDNKPNGYFSAIAIFFWPFVLPAVTFSWFIAKAWEAFAELLAGSYVVRSTVVRTREVTLDQMTREQEAAQRKELKTLAVELRRQAREIELRATAIEFLRTLDRVEKVLEAYAAKSSEQEVKSAGDAPVSKDIEAP